MESSPAVVNGVLYVQSYDGYLYAMGDPDDSPSVVLNSPSDGVSVSSGSVMFNYTPSDDYGLQNCSLWANFSGSWQVNQSDSSPSSGTVNSFSVTGLSDGVYVWNVLCYDTGGQDSWAASNYTLTVNTSSSGGQVAGSVSIISSPGLGVVGVVILFSMAVFFLFWRKH